MATLKGFTHKKKSWEGIEERQQISPDHWIINVVKDEKVIKSFSTKDFSVNLWKEVDKFESTLGLNRIIKLTAPDGTTGSYSMFLEHYQETGETHGLDVID